MKINPFLSPVLPSLIPLTTGIDIYTRHGALLAAAEVTHALCKYAEEKSRSVKITQLNIIVSIKTYVVTSNEELLIA